MKRRFAILLFALLPLFAPAVFAAEDAPSDPSGIVIDPAEGSIERGGTIHVSFPAAMVGTDAIDAGGQTSPLKFTPPIEGKWYWKSQTEGELQLTGTLLPSQEYRVGLAPGVKTLDGKPLPVPANWVGAKLKTEEFTAKSEFTETERLSGNPQVVVEFSYAVRLADAAERIWFQDRDSLQRFPAEIGLREDDNERDLPEGAVLRVSLREGQLPLGRTFDLIIDGVREATSGAPLPFLRRIPLGRTAPLKIQWLGAINNPLQKPSINVKFDDYIDPATAKPEALRIEPAVPNLKVRAEGDDLIAEGDFDLKTHYRVVVGTELKGTRGYGLAETRRWGATFRPKAGAVFFPGPRVFQRSKLGLRFAFLQVNTGALSWRLAAVPMEKLSAVEARRREFETAKKDPVTGDEIFDKTTGLAVQRDTELLVETFALPVRAKGDFPASGGDAETLREIQWKPAAGEPPLSGFFLLEVSGQDATGDGAKPHLVGHRSLVVFSDAILTQKRNYGSVTVRVAGMNDGLPRAGVKVRALSESNFEVASEVTDSDGLARFPTRQLRPPKDARGGEPAEYFVAETDAGPALRTLDSGGLDDVYIPTDSANERAVTQLRNVILTDRPLYRPGHTVKIKGLARTVERQADGNEQLVIPAGKKLEWRITRGYSSELAVEGETFVNADGGWEAEWIVPEGAKLGRHSVHCSVGGLSEAGGDDVAVGATFMLQEYKTPLFEVKALADADPAPGKSDKPAALLRVDAHYFSGQPVVGAKVQWRASWNRTDYTANEFTLSDHYSEKAAPSADDNAPEIKGEAKLDANGSAIVRVEPPANLPGARYDAQWTIAVTSADGQSVSPTDSEIKSIVMLQPALLGIKAETAPVGQPRGVKVETTFLNKSDEPAEGDVGKAGAAVEVFRVTTKTAKERVAPFVFRYRNTPVYTSFKKLTVRGGETVPVNEPGRYVLVAEAPGLKRVSAEVFVEGAEPDEVPVKNDTSLEAKAEKAEYTPGQVAAFVTRAPITGVAWVSIETDHILDTLLVKLPGNTSKIEVPVKKEYAPNAKVAIYLVRPGADDRLPAERFASADLNVSRPDLQLEAKPRFAKASVRPGEKVSGSVEIRCEGKPVADADVTVYAVDDAVLALGSWKALEPLKLFYPRRSHWVKTYGALHDYVSGIERRSLFQKGFTVGGGGEEFGARFVRKDFRPLAMWKTNLKSDAAGKVPFEFDAPDNLTRYRVVAVAQTRANQFGAGDDVVEVAKPLQIEPSLPRFLRVGDEVELRAVVRQSARDRDKLSVTCTTDAGLKLLDANSAAPTVADADRNAPLVARFRAKVADLPGAKISFTATSANDANIADAVEMTLPIYPPTILRRESVAGTVTPSRDGSSPDIGALLPPTWKLAAEGGRYDLAIATSPNLPRLQGLPGILEYPHGCFEQISSRVMAFSALQSLFAAVPADPEQTAAWRLTVERQLRLYERSLLSDGSLPYWPGGQTADPFVTVQAAWAVKRAVAADFTVPEELAEKLNGAVGKIVERASGKDATSAYLRAFALMVSVIEEEEDGGANEKAARELFLNRETLGDEGRALLAMAMHGLKILSAEKEQLLREIDKRPPPTEGPERAFNPRTFSTNTRTFATEALAFSTIRPAFWDAKKQAAMRTRLNALLERAPQLSTQENLWSLFAYDALQKGDKYPKLKVPRAKPQPTRVSADGTAAAWVKNDLVRGGADLKLEGLNSTAVMGALFYVLNAEYRVANVDDEVRADRGGLRVERVVRNLTDPTRTGLPGAPAVKLNDRLLVTYRLASTKLRNYLALDDELPAGLEIVNPDLAMFAGFYEIPQPARGERVAEPSHTELRDQKANLYLDVLEPGVTTCSVLCRAVAAGNFRWPSTQAAPMYDPSVSGLSPAANLVVEQ